MKKILSILLMCVLMFSLVACGNNNTKVDENTNEQTNGTDVGIEDSETVEQNPNRIDVFIDDTFEYKISFSIPQKFENQYSQKIQSDFSNGYYGITIGVKDTDYDLFTIYCTKSKDLSEFENKKGYELLKTDDKYSYIWFEHEYTYTDDAQKPQLVTDFETEYKNIKSSFSVE